MRFEDMAWIWGGGKNGWARESSRMVVWVVMLDVAALFLCFVARPPERRTSELVSYSAWTLLLMASLLCECYVVALAFLIFIHFLYLDVLSNGLWISFLLSVAPQAP